MTRTNVPTNYWQADTLYKSRRNDGRYYKRLSTNLKLQSTNSYTYGEGIELILYSTPVVTFWQNNYITLRHNGWTTTTTSKVINAALRDTPLRVGSNGKRPSPDWVVYGTQHTAEQVMPRRRCMSCNGNGNGHVEYHTDWQQRPFKSIRKYVPSSYPCYRCDGSGYVTPTRQANPLFITPITLDTDGNIYSEWTYDDPTIATATPEVVPTLATA
jgi:hypothetical protein